MEARKVFWKRSVVVSLCLVFACLLSVAFAGDWNVAEDFEEIYPSEWKLLKSAKLSSSSEQVKSGKLSGKLEYSYTFSSEDSPQDAGQKRWCADITRSIFFLEEHPNQIRLWIYGDGSGSGLSTTLADSTKEKFSYVSYLTWEGWQEVIFDLSSYTWHYHGNNDAVIDYPVRFDGFSILAPGGKSIQSAIYLDDFSYRKIERVWEKDGWKIIEDFEYGHPVQWVKWYGDSKVTQSKKEGAPRGNFAGKFEYSSAPSAEKKDSGATIYGPKRLLEGKPKELSLWICSDGSNTQISVQLEDSTGERFAYDLPSLYWEGWSQQTIYLEKPSYPIKNTGNSDGVLDYPLRFFIISLAAPKGKGNEPHKTTFYIDEISYK